MKKLILLLAICFGNIALYNAIAQEAKSNLTISKAQENSDKLDLELTQAQFELVSKNIETYYKDFLEIAHSNTSDKRVAVSISAKKPENSRVLKRVLISAEIKEIQFVDKKASIDEFFGY